MSPNNRKKRKRLLLIIGIITSLTVIASNLIQLINYEHSKILLTIGISTVILYFLINSLNGKRGALRISILSGIFITILGVLLIVLNFYDFLPKRKNKVFEEGYISIGITKFDDTDENFSLITYEFLKEKNLPDSIYRVKKIDNNYFECISDSTFSEKLDSLNLKSGLLISGKRCTEDELFYCKIRIRNLYTKINKDSVANQLITFRNPNLHEFSIDNQAQILVDFVLAILSFSEQNFEVSENLFNHCISSNRNNANTKFLSDCYIFLGDIYSIERENKKAFNSYLKSYELNKSDEVLKPIINALLVQKKYKQAIKYYDKIQNKKDIELESLRKRLNDLKTYYKNLKSPKTSDEVINIPSQGSFSVDNNDSTKLTINYISLTQFNFQDKSFFIYESDKSLFGIFDSHGVLIKLPEFKEISKAKIFIKEIMK